MMLKGISILLIFTALISNVNAEPALEGFTLNASPEAVKAEFEKRGFNFKEGTSQKGSPYYSSQLKKDKDSTTSFTMYMTEDKKNLVKLILNYNYPGKSGLETKLKAQFTEQYGKPTSEISYKDGNGEHGGQCWGKCKVSESRYGPKAYTTCEDCNNAILSAMILTLDSSSLFGESTSASLVLSK